MDKHTDTGETKMRITDQPWAKNPRFVEVRVRETEGVTEHEHAWTWVDGDSERMACDNCGAEKLELWNSDLGVYESVAVNKEGRERMEAPTREGA